MAAAPAAVLPVAPPAMCSPVRLDSVGAICKSVSLAIVLTSPMLAAFVSSVALLFTIPDLRFVMLLPPALILPPVNLKASPLLPVAVGSWNTNLPELVSPVIELIPVKFLSSFTSIVVLPELSWSMKVLILAPL